MIIDQQIPRFAAAFSYLFLASSGQSASVFPGGGGGLVALIVCNATKRNQIGGWLLFFFWQLYGGLLLTAIFFATNIQSYVLENFESPEKGVFFLISTVPSLIIYLAEVMVGTILLSARTWDLLKLLRWLIAAEAVASLVSMVIDSKYFPDNTWLNILTLVPQVLWLAYFLASKRVKHVFKSHDWEMAVNAIHPLKPKIAS